MPRYSFKATVIVESVTALLQLDEIIFALKDRIVGLNAGKWNYLSSVVKQFRN
jgi:malate synthase